MVFLTFGTGYGKTGAFEAFCSGGGIAALARAAAEERLDAGQRVAFCAGRESLPLITAQTVGEAAETGDVAAREMLALSGKFLGRGLALIIDILNPQRIVIGSTFARCRKFLQPAVDEEITRKSLVAAARVCEVVPAALGERIGDYACLTVAVAHAEGADNGSSR